MDSHEAHRLHQLARIPAHHPDRCRFGPHDLTPWGPYVPVARPLPSPSPYDQEPEYRPVEAWRERFCRRGCGYAEQENYDRTRSIISDEWR